jgi:saccharopine dehydrogenase-like NADP-dependent oxidoreductase
MRDSTQRTGSVHWVGAGLSNGSGLRRVAERADRMMLWNRNLARVEELAGRLKLPAAVEMRPFKLAELSRALSAGDIVVSMLPATQHAALLETCIERRAHFACSSYVSDAISELVPVAARAGLVVLTESGLDPGLDHLLARELVARGHQRVPPLHQLRILLRRHTGDS